VVTGMDHALAVAPAGRHRLLGHDVTASRGHLDGLLGVQPAGCSQDDDVCIRSRQESFQAPKARCTSTLLGPCEGGGIDIANADQLSPFGMFFDSSEVVF
jgi:hypothetical protein